MTEQEKTLCEALSFARIEELPAEAIDGSWKKAIALVTKATNRQSYVIAKNVDGAISIIKDFGNISMIISVDKIYPYEGASGRIDAVDAPSRKTSAPKATPVRRGPKAK